MKFPKLSPRAFRTQPAEAGVALIVVLVLVVLVTGVVVAFFSRSSLNRQVSQGSVGQTKVDLLAAGALSVIVGDLRQEILAGSTVYTNSPGQNFYVPKNGFTVVPFRNGVPTAATNPIPNLVSRSVRPGNTTNSPYVPHSATYVDAPPNRTADDTGAPGNVSSSTPSANGRTISLSRWNSHYLIPRAVGATDTTPVSEFVAPDWVIITRGGASAITGWNNTLKDSRPSNTGYAIGRYAYAIYDEGGLLDINVAGHPSNLTVAQLGQKIGLALADLTQLKDRNGNAMNQTDIDNIVGWRNFATANLGGGGGSFDNFTFTSAMAGNWLTNFVKNNTTGFLKTSDSTSGGQTDQAFLSRQQLIKMQSALGFSADFLQYFGTFSRDLEQPSFAPDPNRPRVQSSSGVQPNSSVSVSANDANFGSGNDAFGLDREPEAWRDINPPLLAVRVPSSFTRNDGSIAVVGEPLLKKRFPLPRLSLIRRNPTGSDADKIKAFFGLTWNNSDGSTHGFWTYDHGDPGRIKRLSEITGREPDFFELLKAAINVGSIAKSSLQGEPNANGNLAFQNVGSISNLQHLRDVRTNHQILQIGANIIDQYDANSYCTRIRFDTAPASDEVKGIEDLPYIYYMRNRPVFKDRNKGAWLLQPVLWNPHDPASGQPDSAPTSFRLRAESVGDQQYFEITYRGGGGATPQTIPQTGLNLNAAAPLTFNAGPGFYGFRQPTLLAEPGIPAGTNLAGSVITQADVSAPKTLTGLLALDDFDIWIPNPSPPPARLYMNTIGWREIVSGLGSTDFILEYFDGDWVAFDALSYYWDVLPATTVVIPTNTVTNDATFLTHLTNRWTDDSTSDAIDKNTLKGRMKVDPRTRRWINATLTEIERIPAVDRANNTYETFRGGTGNGWALSNVGGWRDNGFNFYGAYLVATGWRGAQSGYAEENSVRDAGLSPAPPDGNLTRYYRDPDGIIRRAMGGYTSDPDNGGGVAETMGRPLVTNNVPSRPFVLNRPFATVGELAYVFRGDPWKNLSFSFAESGDAALLDVFCINELTSSEPLVAGRVNLNTRQQPVLHSILAATNTDTTDSSRNYSAGVAGALATALVDRTTSTNTGEGPLINRSDLVGRWISPLPSVDAVASALRLDPNAATYYSSYYNGFSADVGTIPELSGTADSLIPRRREAAIRALAESGQTRVWNLMIDVIAQTGRYSPSASNLRDFTVDGEKRYWLHIAIDRATGAVLDQQLEVVSE